MPSPRHDTINRLFRDRPVLAVEILREQMGVDVPAAAPVRLESNDFNDRPAKDFQPDTVITVGAAHPPLHGIVVEVQQDRSDAKRRQLPRYAAALWLLLRCPVTVLCICPDADAAAWYAAPISTDLPGYLFRAVVLGPGEIPAITDPEGVAVHPELAAMSVMVHGWRRPVAEAFVGGLSLLKPEHAPQYYEHAYSMAAPAVRHILEEIMSSATWPVYSPFAREHYGRGKDEGLTEGRAEGLTEGRVEGEANAVLRVLAARRIEVPEDARARICACTDLRQLDTWLDRAVIATSIADLFD
jgi:hypothetical protein